MNFIYRWLLYLVRTWKEFSYYILYLNCFIIFLHLHHEYVTEQGERKLRGGEGDTRSSVFNFHDQWKYKIKTTWTVIFLLFTMFQNITNWLLGKTNQSLCTNGIKFSFSFIHSTYSSKRYPWHLKKTLPMWTFNILH